MIQNIDWNLHSTCYRTLFTSEKRNISRCIHHRLLSGKIIFELKHHCPYCRLLPDSNTDRDHFLTCINSRHQKDTGLKTLTIRLNKLNTLPPLRSMIFHHVNNYYNNDLLPDLQNTNTNLLLDECMNKQTSIGWNILSEAVWHRPSTPLSTDTIDPISSAVDSNPPLGIATLSDLCGSCIIKLGSIIVILFTLHQKYQLYHLQHKLLSSH